MTYDSELRQLREKTHVEQLLILEHVQALQTHFGQAFMRKIYSKSIPQSANEQQSNLEVFAYTLPTNDQSQYLLLCSNGRKFIIGHGIDLSQEQLTDTYGPHDLPLSANLPQNYDKKNIEKALEVVILADSWNDGSEQTGKALNEAMEIIKERVTQLDNNLKAQQEDFTQTQTAATTLGNLRRARNI